MSGAVPRLDAPEEEPAERFRSLGDPRIDAALGGGIPESGLCEIHVNETREAGALAGFGLALAARLGASARRPVLWLADAQAFREGGLPYGPGLSHFGLDPAALLLVRTRRLEEAAWGAEEAASCAGLSLAILEVRGNPERLALEGTRRLHWRAKAAGLPLLVLRQAGRPDATAAPLRLRLEPAPAAPVALPGAHRLIGHPILRAAIEKSRHVPPSSFLLEWNPHERRFRTPPARLPEPHPGRVPAAALDGSHPARTAGEVLALRAAS